MSSSAITGPVLSDVSRSQSGTAAAPSWSFVNSTATGMYLVSSNVLGITTAGAQRMVVDASGNVGIGTGSPGSKVEIVQSTLDSSVLKLTAAYGTAAERYQSIAFSNSSFSGGNSEIRNIVNGSASTGSTLAFFTTQTGSGPLTERMRLDSSGNLLIGLTTAVRTGDRVSISGTGTQVATFQQATNTSGYSSISSQIQANGNNTSSYHFWANTNTVGNWYLYGNGTSSFSSDERLKKNIESTRYGYLEDLCKLRVVKYNWKNDEEFKPKELGLIAQEVEKVFPGLVQDDLNPAEVGGEIYKQLKVSVLPFMLLKAIQEQQEIIGKLEARLAALESK